MHLSMGMSGGNSGSNSGSSGNSSGSGHHSVPPPPPPPPPTAFRRSSYASVVSGGGGTGSAGIAPQNLQRPSRSVSHFSTSSTSYPLPGAGTGGAGAGGSAGGGAAAARSASGGVPSYLVYPTMAGSSRHSLGGYMGDGDGLGAGYGGGGGGYEGRDGASAGAGAGAGAGSGNNYGWYRIHAQPSSNISQYGHSTNGQDGNSATATGTTGVGVGLSGGNSGAGGGGAGVSGRTASPAAPQFFIPSYLRGSRHAERLEEARRARLLAQQREARKGTGSTTIQPHNGASLSASSSSVSLHKLANPSASGLPPAAAAVSSSSTSSSAGPFGPHAHRGLAHEIVERVPGSTSSSSAIATIPPAATTTALSTHVITGSSTGINSCSASTPQQLEESLAPLPSRWSETDRFSGLDVLGDGCQVRFTSSKTGTHDEAGAVRADHPMPRRCGLYYYEIEVLSKGKERYIL